MYFSGGCLADLVQNWTNEMEDEMEDVAKEPQAGQPVDFSQFWRIPEGDCELLTARYSTQVFGRHAHDRYAIGAISGGVERLFYRGTHWHGVQGSVVAITPGEIHDGTPATDEGWMYQMLYIDPIWLNEKVFRGQVSRDYIHLFDEPLRQDPDLAVRILNRHRMIRQSCLPLERETVLIELLADVLGRYCPANADKVGSEREAVRRVKEMLEQNFDKNITLTELGKLVDMDPLYLIRVFRKEVGISPHSYQLQKRVAQSQRLLRAGMTIADVSTSCGFYDQSHMSRLFKKITGVTPGTFRNGTCVNKIIVFGKNPD